MGNILPEHNHLRKGPIPYKEDQNDSPLHTVQIVPKRPPPPTPPSKPAQTSTGETDDMLDRIDGQLTVWKKSIRQMKQNKSRDTQQHLYKMMYDTERGLHDINQQVQQNKSKSDTEQDEYVLHNVLVENEKNQDEIRRLKWELSEEKRNACKLQSKIEEKRAQIKVISEEKDDLLSRLSKVAGEKLVENNPAITNLNDKNRPSKLGELYSEIYDNEWTDAFEALRKAECGDEFAIETLHLTLNNVFDFCKSKSDSMLRKTEDAVNFLFDEYPIRVQSQRNPQHIKSIHVRRAMSRKSSWLTEDSLELFKRWGILTPQNNMAMAKHLEVAKSSKVTSHVKLLQKEVAESMAPAVHEAYMRSIWIDSESIPNLEPFLRKCIFLCWMMVVQSPAMCFHQTDQDAPFDKNMYREYTSSGKKLKYVVWPALLLHENGPLVYKGVAQAEH